MISSRTRRRSARAALGAAALAALAIGASAPSSVAATGAGGATIAGRVLAPDGVGLYGMRIEAQPAGSDCAAMSMCAAQTTSGPGGRYTLRGLAAGGYTVVVVDGSTPLQLATVTLRSSTATKRVSPRLPDAAVPMGTAPAHASRDLSWLNAERKRDGLPAGITLNPRWSAQCAAHDAYERANDVLQTTEDPAAPGASAGGAWAGLNSALAQQPWTRASTPWEDAPIHLLAMLAPSLRVTGIDDSGGRQCAITTPGMVRAPVRHDALHTVPGAGARNVAGSELARESPFTPPEFAGLPAGQPTGRELFVYLNRAGVVGQTSVGIASATLTRHGRRVAVRWVDNTTPRIGDYLAGGIVIPVAPLRPGATYRAKVTVRDGSRTLTRAWSFTTRRGGSGAPQSS